MRKRATLLVIALSSAILTISGCDGGGDENNIGPWLGDWILVNFLADDDDGVWDEDEPSGIGLVSRVTESEWVLAETFGDECAVTFSYSVSSNGRYSREVISRSDDCESSSLPIGTIESGRLEFSADDERMEEYFDGPGGLIAFRWLRD